MSEFVTPEAAGLLALMSDERRLPDDWDVSSFWLAHAQQLAQFLADHGKRLPSPDAGMLLGLGGMLLVMARREREAADVSACLIDRSGRGGSK